MVRSRDFLLFVVVLAVLSVGIGATVFSDIFVRNASVAHEVVYFDEYSGSRYVASAVVSEVDRTSNIAKFKEKIAAGLGVDNGAAVLTSVDEVPTTSGQTASENVRQAQYCPGYSVAPSILSKWPGVGVTTTFIEGARLVRVAEVSQDEGDDVRPALVERTLLQLPVLTLRSNFDSCLDSVVVGVDVHGKPIRNSDTARYASYHEYSQIGYARDGFPIYGYKKDESDLDSCGGVQTEGGYRYYLRADEDFVLGCFAGPPAQFR